MAFTCSKSTKETQEQYEKCVRSKQRRHHNDVSDVVLVSLLLTLDTDVFIDLKFFNNLFQLSANLTEFDVMHERIISAL